MGSSCSSGPKKKDKGSHKSEQNGGGNSHRGSNASSASMYVYQKSVAEGSSERTTAPVAVPTPAPLASVTSSAVEFSCPTLVGHGKSSVERSDSHTATPMSPLSPTQLLRQASKDAELDSRFGPPPLHTLPAVVQRLLVGDMEYHLDDHMPTDPREIVVFVCACPDDWKEERIWLADSILPKVISYCAQKGFELRVVDPSSAPPKLGPAVERHLAALAKEHVPCVPLLLVNEKVGRTAPPPEISVCDWCIMMELARDPQDRLLIGENFEKRGHRYIRKVPVEADDHVLEELDGQLVDAMRRVMDDVLQEKYLCTILERMVRVVCATGVDLAKNAICVFRRQVGHVNHDDRDDGDMERAMALHLCLSDALDETRMIQFRLRSQADMTRYLEDLCAQLLPILVSCVDSITDNLASSPLWKMYLGVERRLLMELAHQTKWAQERSTEDTWHPFDSLTSVRDAIHDYLQSEVTNPLVICGPEGCGKSSLMARVVRDCSMWVPDASVVFRFVGLTPDSSSEDQLLRSITEQLCFLVGEHPSRGLREVVRHGVQPLSSGLLTKMSPGQTVIIIIDGLDAISGNQAVGGGLRWMPAPDTLPENVRMLVSVRTGSEAYIKLRDDLAYPKNSFINFQPVSIDELRVLMGVHGSSPDIPEFMWPLHASLAAHCSKWAPDVSSQALVLLEECEEWMGSKDLASAILGSLSLCKHGASTAELMELAGSEQGHWTITIAETLAPFLFYRTVGQRTLWQWSSRTLRDVCLKKYTEDNTMVQRLKERWESCVDGWGDVSNRRKLDELPFAQWACGLSPEEFLERFVFAPEWLALKVSATDVYQVVEDLDLVLASKEVTPYVEEVKQLRKTLMESSIALAYDGRQLYSQLYSRLVLADLSKLPRLRRLWEVSNLPPTPCLLPLVIREDNQEVRGLDGLVAEDAEEDSPRYPQEEMVASLHRVKGTVGLLACLSPSGGEIRVWDAFSVRALRTLQGVVQPRDLKFIDSNRAVVLCGRELKIYDLDAAKCVTKLKGVMNQKMAYYGLHDADHVVALSRNRMYVNMMNLNSGDCVATFKVGEDRFLNSLLVSANGRVCVCGDETQKPFPLLVWDLSSRKLLYDLRIPHHEFVTSLSAITNDGHYVVCVCKEVNDPSPNFIVVYDLQNGTLFKKWKPEVNTCSIAISSESGCVVTGLVDTSLLVWDLTTGACRFTLHGHTAPVTHIRLDSNGVRCATLDLKGRDKSLRLWDITKGVCLASYFPDAHITCCEMSSDGSAVVVGLRDRDVIATLVLCDAESVDSVLDRVERHSFGDESLDGLVVNLEDA